MSGQWFSNRGQMIQVACAVSALIIGIVTQWSQISVALNLTEIIKVLAYPATVFIVFQIALLTAKNGFSKPTPTTTHVGTEPKPLFGPPLIYEFKNATVKVGSFFEVGEEFGLRRVSVLSLKNLEIYSEEVAAAELEFSGSMLDLSFGKKTQLISNKKALIPSYARSAKDADCSIYQFSYQLDYFTFVAVSVDHINVPEREVSLVVCIARFRKSPGGIEAAIRRS